MDTIKEKFYEFIKRNNIELWADLSDVISSNMKLSVGDQIMFTNDYGITFGPYEVLGFCEPSEYSQCIYFEHESFWCPCKVYQIKKVLKSNCYIDRAIYLVEDAFMQKFTMIDGDNNLYASIEDAKRVIRGEQPKYVIN